MGKADTIGAIVLLALIAFIIYVLVQVQRNKDIAGTAKGIVVNPMNGSNGSKMVKNGGGVVSGQGFAEAFWRGHADPKVGTNGLQGQAAYTKTPNMKYGAYDYRYPMSEDPLSRYATSIGEQTGYKLSVDSLMPGSWKAPASSTFATADQQQWAKYAPTKAAFDKYITAGGSVRAPLNTRSPLARQVGIPYLIRQGPPIPLSSKDVIFNDSGFRQDLVYNSTGYYPLSSTAVHC